MSGFKGKLRIKEENYLEESYTALMLWTWYLNSNLLDSQAVLGLHYSAFFSDHGSLRSVFKKCCLCSVMREWVITEVIKQFLHFLSLNQEELRFLCHQQGSQVNCSSKILSFGDNSGTGTRLLSSKFHVVLSK